MGTFFWLTLYMSNEVMIKWHFISSEFLLVESSQYPYFSSPFRAIEVSHKKQCRLKGHGRGWVVAGIVYFCHGEKIFKTSSFLHGSVFSFLVRQNKINNLQVRQTYLIYRNVKFYSFSILEIQSPITGFPSCFTEITNCLCDGVRAQSLKASYNLWNFAPFLHSSTAILDSQRFSKKADCFQALFMARNLWITNSPRFHPSSRTRYINTCKCHDCWELS